MNTSGAKNAKSKNEWYSIVLLHSVRCTVNEWQTEDTQDAARKNDEKSNTKKEERGMMFLEVREKERVREQNKPICMWKLYFVWLT